MIKSSRMGWVGHVALVGEKRDGHIVVMNEMEGNRPQAWMGE
jgi:hypothetical protein